MEKEPHVFEEDDEAFLRSLNALLEEPEPQETQAPQDAPMPKKPQVGKKKMPPKTGGFWKKLGIGTAIAALWPWPVSWAFRPLPVLWTHTMGKSSPMCPSAAWKSAV